jgi:undecaprenyl-diphosphatase
MDILYALHRADVRLFEAVFRLSSRSATAAAAKAISRTADGYLFALVPAVLWLAGAQQLATLLQLLLLSLCVQLPLYWLLKNGLRRRRPQDSFDNFQSLVVAADKFSFPSGHTAAAFLLATSLSLVYGGAFIGVFAWATAVAVSRVALGVHYPGDTLAGAVMGVAVASCMYSYLGAY